MEGYSDSNEDDVTFVITYIGFSVGWSQYCKVREVFGVPRYLIKQNCCGRSYSTPLLPLMLE